MKRIPGILSIAMTLCLIGSCDGGGDSGSGSDDDTTGAGSDAGNSVDDGPTQPTNLVAQAVGAWYGGGACDGTNLEYGLFLCPGGRIRGAGAIGNTTELVCGTFEVSGPTLANCNDRIGCFPKITATYKSTLLLGGQQDVQSGVVMELLQTSPHSLARLVNCANTNNLPLQRVPGDVDGDDCASDACPAHNASDGGYGLCNTDCDCGYCWYCEEGACRYGGQGEHGCYRGCPFMD